MTEIKNLTETDTLFENNLFVIFDGTKTRSIEASAVKTFCAQNGIGTDEAFIAGRIANNILYMTRATGEEIAIGDLETFDLAEHKIQELQNVPPLESDKFLKVSKDGQSIEYSVADPQGDEIGIEDSGTNIGKAQNINFNDQLRVTFTGNTATINGTVVPSGYKNLGILSGGDDPKTLDTGICYVSSQFVDAPTDFPTPDYQGYLIKQKLLKTGEDQSADTAYQLIIYYSIYGTYLKAKYAGVWSDGWYTMLTHNTDQDITADKRFKANSHLGFNRQSDDKKDAYKLIADANEFFLKAFSNEHSSEVDSIKVDQNGRVSFPNNLDFLLTDQPDNQKTPQEITAEKKFINSAALSFINKPGGYVFRTDGDNLRIFSNDNYPNGAWRHAISIDRFGKVSFPNTPNIVLTDKEQVISSKKTFQSVVSMDQFSELWFKRKGSGMEGAVRFRTNLDNRPGRNMDNLDIIAWNTSTNKFETALIVTEKAQVWINAYRGFAMTIQAPQLAPRSMQVIPDGNFPIDKHLEKIQIRTDEAFDAPLTVQIHDKSENGACLEEIEVDLSSKGVHEIPIARTIKKGADLHITLKESGKGCPSCGKAELFLLLR